MSELCGFGLFKHARLRLTPHAYAWNNHTRAYGIYPLRYARDIIPARTRVNSSREVSEMSVLPR